MERRGSKRKRGWACPVVLFPQGNAGHGSGPWRKGEKGRPSGGAFCGAAALLEEELPALNLCKVCAVRRDLASGTGKAVLKR